MTFAGVQSVLLLLARLLPRRHRPRFVRRVELRCPHRCEMVEVDLLEGADGGQRPVLRCSAHRDCPPTCDHACRTLPEAFGGIPRARLILPPGNDVPDEID